LDVVGHPVDCLDDSLVRIEVSAEVFYLQQWRHYSPSLLLKMSLSATTIRPSVGNCQARKGRVVGKRRLELLRLAAHDPKSCSSANSDTSPLSRSRQYRPR